MLKPASARFRSTLVSEKRRLHVIDILSEVTIQLHRNVLYANQYLNVLIKRSG